MLASMVQGYQFLLTPWRGLKMLNQFDMKLTQKLLKQYKKANKKEKGLILDQYCQLTKVKRKTAIKRFNRALINYPYPRVLKVAKIKARKGPKVKYGPEVKAIIKLCWQLAGGVCAEKLHPMVGVYLDQLKNNHLLTNYTPCNITLSQQISLATLKRIISTFPRSQPNKHKGNSLIYKQIPIMAYFGRYAHDAPGFIEVDFVNHCGDSSLGPYAISGCFVDVYSQWIARAAGMGKNLMSMTRVVKLSHQRIYHPIKHYHPDNDKAILKVLFEKVQRLRQQTKGVDLQLSRSRPYQKNDNAHVEQKNHDKIRKLVGYHRYDTREEVDLLNQIYEVSDLIDNFFIASAKLKKKITDDKGRVIKRIHDTPMTPYQRLISHPDLDHRIKNRLTKIYQSLNLVQLRYRLETLLDQLFKLQASKRKHIKTMALGDKKYDLTRAKKKAFRRHLIII